MVTRLAYVALLLLRTTCRRILNAIDDTPPDRVDLMTLVEALAVDPRPPAGSLPQQRHGGAR